MEQARKALQNPFTVSLAKKIIIGLSIGMLFLLGGVLLFAANSVATNSILKEVLTLLGGALVISIPASFVYKLTFRPLDDEKQAGDLKKLLDEKIDSLMKSRHQFKLASIQDHIDFQQLFDELQEGESLYWLDTWAPRSDAFQINMEKCLQRGANIKMLILDPSSEMCKHRALEIVGPIGRGFCASQAAFLERMKGIQKETSTKEPSTNDGTLEIRTYDELLGVPSYIVCQDNKPIRGWSSLYLGDATGYRYPHFHWEGGDDSVLNLIYNYVREKWERNQGNAIVVDQPAA